MSAGSATLLISCPDQRGLVAAVTQFIFQHNGNILHLDQHVDQQAAVFFMRVEWDLTGFGIARADIPTAFGLTVGNRFKMDWTLRFSDETPRMALFVSKQSHCLYDILSRWQAGEWQVAIPLIVSNHESLKPVADSFDIPFHHFAISADTKAEQERAQIDLLKAHKVEFVVLARYMQILTGQFIGAFPNRIINIHHSFLPAFAGAKPYHAAHARGVKLIGATSHYVTADLDAGPIIAQDVIPVNHKDSVSDLVRKGQDIEKLVLAQAVWHHLQNRVLVYNNKTVVFQ
ncbi:MAG: formyltetrahydrofolate deformylase [Chloroflexi bacterium]|jgi:formyltetrahydrofolate deformylase|nr:Formyltetrahydrofolate deformylase [Anaerolineae bacterium]MCC6565098.1 formyltetrahydrofolate deformylase [Chloroflexota bacterium]MDL1916213.1 formyltetrahydrofolate deformylase [Anaerolineae bacterium CFX4]OQY86170.1 MAG: formyltetrahydrofolate deformylase [Anaerolineae bacterium UTCFX5]RIK21960.1 MAG: formyltetrahydrofolate deformylase [Chloroflexota bacterium]